MFFWLTYVSHETGKEINDCFTEYKYALERKAVKRIAHILCIDIQSKTKRIDGRIRAKHGEIEGFS